MNFTQCHVGTSMTFMAPLSAVAAISSSYKKQSESYCISIMVLTSEQKLEEKSSSQDGLPVSPCSSCR